MADNTGKEVPRTDQNVTQGRAASAQGDALVEGGSAVGFYVLFGVAALALLIFAFTSLSHSRASEPATVINRIAPTAPAALTPPVELPQSSPSPSPTASPPVSVPAPLAAAPPNAQAGPASPAVPTDQTVAPLSTPPSADNKETSETAPVGVPTVPAVDDSTPVAPSISAPIPRDANDPVASTAAGNSPEAYGASADAPAPAVTSNGQARL